MVWVIRSFHFEKRCIGFFWFLVLHLSFLLFHILFSDA